MAATSGAGPGGQAGSAAAAQGGSAGPEAKQSCLIPSPQSGETPHLPVCVYAGLGVQQDQDICQQVLRKSAVPAVSILEML